MASIKVGFLLDGDHQGYGVYSYIKLLLNSLDRTSFTLIGYFVGRGKAYDSLGGHFEKTVLIGEKHLLPLTDPDRPKWDPRVLLSRAYRFVCSIPRLRRMLLRDHLDVLDINFYPLHVIAGLACRHTNVKCVGHWHGPFTRKGILGWVARHILARRMDVVPCISRFVRDSLPDSVQSRATVLYNGVDSKRIASHQVPGPLREKARVSESEILVGIFGAIAPRKGHAVFVDAAARVLRAHPDTTFVVVGSESKTLRARVNLTANLMRQAEGLGIREKICFLGHLEEAWQYMCDCHAICMPTVPIGLDKGEGFGLVMAEAMAAGVPVIATNCGAPPEVIEDGISGLLVPPSDAEVLAAAILKLLEDEQYRNSMGIAAQERIRDHFDISCTTRQLEDLYFELAGFQSSELASG